MKKLIIALALLCSTAQGADHTFYNENDEYSSQNTVRAVEARIMRHAELQNDVSIANLKIAAFEVEIAKVKLEKSIAEAGLARLEQEDNK
ncbi:hypothetical protein Hena1_01810 [Erwinia phage Hena1]|uniref:Uncharacterized protein n=1 Tax=Erwinia phage Hena1 TaxID=2678601 RepID=A0A6B9J5U9_9CAUD|nr:hypothetical protein HWC84_gp183 [Erwinia phage Hena1]QGZ16331.1 hypothetical protein Hena1_01810 [Erwinia phage Hena1]